MPSIVEWFQDLDMDDRLKVRVFSWSSGILFSLGWWLFIDAEAQNGYTEDPLPIKAQLVLLPVGSTLSFLIISLMDWSSLTADEYSHHGGRMVAYQGRALLAFAVLLSLTCVIVSVVVLSEVYVHKKGIKGQIPDDVYPGVAICICTICLLVASILMRLGRVSDDFF